jgi:hypothetical protein
VLIRYFAAFAPPKLQPEPTVCLPRRSVCLPRLRAGAKPVSAFRDHALSTSSLRRWNRGRPESPPELDPKTALEPKIAAAPVP